MKSCTKCKFYDKPLSLCRKNPPAPNGAWPKVYSDDWCGEFKPLSLKQKREQSDE